MRKNIKLLLSLILVVCLVMAMVPGMAHASSLVLNVGQTYECEFVYYTDIDAWDVYCIGGSLPPGMNYCLDWTGYGVAVFGTPSVPGTYYSSYCVVDEFGEDYFDVAITVNDYYNPQPQPQPIYNPPTLTKSPTGETTQAGGSATFVSRANNYTGLVWYICRSDFGQVIEASAIGAYFEGAWASGYYSETLTIGNLPKSINGWYVECEFVNDYGSVTSNAASINVTSPKPAPTPAPKPTPAPTAAPAPAPTPEATATPAAAIAQLPTITAQPENAVRAEGKAVTLSVSANAPDNGTLSYQWYESANMDGSNMVAINGATASNLTPQESDSTRYYCVEIKNTIGESVQVTRSKIVSVKPEAKEEAAPTATPSPAPTVTPVQAVPASGNTVILYAIIGVLAVAVVALVIALGKRKQ